MFKNYLKIAWRNLLKNKTFSLINIAGLASGLACFILITLYIIDELSYDRFHEKADRIYRVHSDIRFGGTDMSLSVASDPMGATLKKDYPQVGANKNFARDAVNVAVGIVWQTSLVAAPIFMVIKHWPEFIATMVVAAITSIFLWFNWYKKLEDYPLDTPASALQGTNDEYLLTKT